MKIRVGVFFGGQSTEHEVSCISASQAMQAMDTDKYEIIPVYISKEKDFYTGDALRDLANYGDLNALKNSCENVSLVKEGKHTYLRSIKRSLFKNYEQELDVAFLVMHGTGGEDGTLQGLLEMNDLPYTSSAVLGSAIGQDKEIMKEVLAFNGIPMVPFFSVNVAECDENEELYRQKAREIGYPLIVKPANLGSSIGIEVIHDEDEFMPKVKEAGKYDFKVVVEKMLTSFKECNCSVLGNINQAECSAIEEVMHSGSILDFSEKYEGNTSSKGAKSGVKAPAKGTKGSKGMASASRKVPADITVEQNNTIKELSLRTFKALNAHGVVRIDFMLDENGTVYVNEINSIPGSLAFYLWQEVGVNFSEECDRLIQLALKRKREQEKKVFVFDTNILKNYGRK